MGFFKEVDLAIREATENDALTQDTWLHFANEHFCGRLGLKELPYEVQQIIMDTEEMYQRVCEDISNKAEVTSDESEVENG